MLIRVSYFQVEVEVLVSEIIESIIVVGLPDTFKRIEGVSFSSSI
ncbi:hypothetical protein ACM26V_15140 [Salipaludibacillus sp. HK11]